MNKLDRVVTKLMLAAAGDAASYGYDWGQAWADQKITEAKAVQWAASKFLTEPWRGWLGAGAFGAAVMKLLDSRLAGAVEWDDALAEVDERSDTIRFLVQGFGASYTIDLDDPHDYVEAPASKDDHSIEIASVLRATGAEASVDHQFEQDRLYADTQNLVFSVTARWKLADFDRLVPDEVKNAFTQGVRAGFRDARAA